MLFPFLGLTKKKKNKNKQKRDGLKTQKGNLCKRRVRKKKEWESLLGWKPEKAT